jgi:NUMOD3 motif-containing protein
MKGNHCSAETRRKGWHHSPETRLKISLAKKGRPSKLKGRHLSEEHRQKLRGRILSPETKKDFDSV